MARFVRFRTELFNAFNHTQFSGLSTTFLFDPQGRNLNPNTGAYTAAFPARTIELALRVVF